MENLKQMEFNELLRKTENKPLKDWLFKGGLKYKLKVPKCSLKTDDAAAKKRKEVAERLKMNKEVNVTKTGEVVMSNYPKNDNNTTLVVPPGKLATSFYWYERDTKLYKLELNAMKTFFPMFKLDKLDDGRLCWIGDLNPRGEDGGIWTIQAVYDNNHPHNNSFGGSVRVYSIKPDLEELTQEVGRLPHILIDGSGNLYMCTARKEDIDKGNIITSAAKSIGWAVKWIWIVEGWLNGEFGDEVFEHTF